MNINEGKNPNPNATSICYRCKHMNIGFDMHARCELKLMPTDFVLPPGNGCKYWESKGETK